MRRPLIVYVDTVSLDRSQSMLDAAARRGISTAIVCPPGGWRDSTGPVARVIETEDFGFANLERITSELENEFEVRGLQSSFGPFRKEGFVHEAVALVAANRRLPHCPIEALYRATNKYLAREALSAAQLPNVPFGLAIDEDSLLAATRSVGYPLVLKPLTGVGSSLILKCYDDGQALDNFRLALRELPRAYYGQLRMARHHSSSASGGTREFDPTRSMLVERYLEGREASVECLVIGDDVIPLVIHDKIMMEETDRVFFEHLLVAPPERFSPSQVANLRDYAVRVVRAIGLRDMFCHVELRYDESAGPLLLEINPRLGAGCVRDSIETFTGIDVANMEVDLIVGDVSRPTLVPRSSRQHALAFLFSPHSGILEEFSGLRRVLRLPEVRVVRVGHVVGDRIGGDYEEVFLASIWMESADANTAQRLYERIRQMVRIRVDRS
jgi:biotin carboxylase